jgi:dTDP-4-amino-4,6-dideoxygalactose transaminase
VFVDEDRYGCMDPGDAARRITARTVGIVPVHLYGGAADLGSLVSLAEAHKLWLVEDCCQAIGAIWGEHKVGSIGRAGCFSFYPSKNLTVFGDGGMVVTNDAALAGKVRKLRDHGRADKYTHDLVGFNLRFNDIQAAVGRKQLALIESFTARRREIAARYGAGLAGIAGLTLPAERPGTRMVWHLYPLRTEDRATRDALAAHLKAAGIETGVHYPLPNHRQPAILALMSPPPLPASEKAGETLLSLPMFPGLTDAEADEVIAAVRGFFAT